MNLGIHKKTNKQISVWTIICNSNKSIKCQTSTISQIDLNDEHHYAILSSALAQLHFKLRNTYGHV